MKGNKKIVSRLHVLLVLNFHMQWYCFALQVYKKQKSSQEVIKNIHMAFKYFALHQIEKDVRQVVHRPINEV